MSTSTKKWYTYTMNIFKCPKKEANSYHHGNLRDALVETVAHILESDGLNAVTMRELSKRLNVSRSAIYRHFDSKDALVVAVMIEGFHRLDAILLPTFEAKQSISARFIMMGRAYLDFAKANPELYRLMFGEQLQDERGESCDITDEAQAVGFFSLVNLIREGQQAGLFVDEEAVYLATVVASSIHGYALLYIDGHTHVQESFEQIYLISASMLLRGMLKPGCTLQQTGDTFEIIRA